MVLLLMQSVFLLLGCMLWLIKGGLRCPMMTCKVGFMFDHNHSLFGLRRGVFSVYKVLFINKWANKGTYFDVF